MSQKRVPVIQIEKVHLRPVRGDVHVKSWDAADLFIEAEDELNAVTEGTTIVVDGTGDCVISMPAGITLSLETVAGDLFVENMKENVVGREVRGDVRLQDTGSVSIHKVNGDVTAIRVIGNLHFDAIGGELIADGVKGNLSAKTGGNARLSAIAGSATLVAGGNAQLRFVDSIGGVVTVKVGGNIDCLVPDTANATFQLLTGGMLTAGRSFAGQLLGGKAGNLTLGDGSMTISLISGGDLSLQTTGDPLESSATQDTLVATDDPTSAVHAKADLSDTVHSLTEQIHAALKGLSNNDQLSEGIRNRIERAFSHIDTKPNTVTTDTAHDGASIDDQQPSDDDASVRRAEAVGNAERAAVLRMLEQGKLTQRQADELLDALER